MCVTIAALNASSAVQCSYPVTSYTKLHKIKSKLIKTLAGYSIARHGRGIGLGIGV